MKVCICVIPCLRRTSNRDGYVELENHDSGNLEYTNRGYSTFKYTAMGGVYSSTEENEEIIDDDEAPEVIISYLHEEKRHRQINEERSFDDMKIPFKLLCDKYIQTEQLEKPCCTCVDNSVQTDVDLTEYQVDFQNVYLTESAIIEPSKCFCDNYAQTDFVIITKDLFDDTDDLETSESDLSNNMISCSESCMQTDHVNISEIKELSDSFAQTDEPFNEFIQSIQREAASDVISGDIWNNYVQTERDQLKRLSIGNELAEAQQRQQNDEWQHKFEDQERKIREEIAMRQLLEDDHREKLESLRRENFDMKQVVAQYENVIVDLTDQTRDRQVSDQTLSATIEDKERLHQDLNNAETNLVDAYKRIEKLKLALDTYKHNEDDLKNSTQEFQLKLGKSEDRYKKLRQQATNKIDAANVEITKVRKQKEIDLAGIQAALKKSQNRNSNLEREIQQKVRENKELSQICDDLIKKVSSE